MRCWGRGQVQGQGPGRSQQSDLELWVESADGAHRFEERRDVKKRGLRVPAADELGRSSRLVPKRIERQGHVERNGGPMT